MKTTVTTKKDVLADVRANIKFMKQLQRPSATVSILDLEALVRMAQEGEMLRATFKQAT